MKKEHTSIEAAVKRKIAKEFGVTYRFVTMSLSKDRDSATAESIKRAYKKLLKEAMQLLG